MPLTADRAATTPSENEVHLVMNAQLKTILRMSALTLLEKNGMATAQDTEEFMGGPIP